MDTYDESKLRKLAERRVKEKRELTSHIIAYVCVNGFLLALNYIIQSEISWALFPLLGWGIGLVIHILTTIKFLMDKGDKVEREMEKLRRRK
ncbi:MAG: 2TM domain-containing protein [Clostridiales bacterium]|nr:2TM domain-containing protein [Clostridiales bacterium]